MKSLARFAFAVILIAGLTASETFPATAPQAVQSVPGKSLHTALPDSVAVTINVKIDLTVLNQLTTTGGVQCWGWAIPGDTDAMSDAAGQVNGLREAELKAIDDALHAGSNLHYDASWILERLSLVRQSLSSDAKHPGMDAPAYYGSQATVSFPITNSEYHDTQAVNFKFVPNELIDPRTKITLSSPQAFFICWLTLNGKLAVFGPRKQLMSASNDNYVDPAIPTISYAHWSPIPGMQ